MGRIIDRRRVMGKKDDTYIQDGLIAWYDGEWNESIGRHNASATQWNNLVDGTTPITNIDSRFTWYDNHLFIPQIQNIGTLPNLVPITLEVVLTFGGSGFYPAFTLPAVNYTQSVWISIRANNTVNFANGGYYAPIQRGAIQSVSALGVSNGYSPINPKAIFINGDDKIIKSGGATGSGSLGSFHSFFYWGSGTTDIYSIRMYNREITEDEVLYNYNIDKQRFNI